VLHSYDGLDILLTFEERQENHYKQRQVEGALGIEKILYLDLLSSCSEIQVVTADM